MSAEARSTTRSAENAPVRILAIDGGGMRGVIPARILAALEEIAGRPAFQLFDLIAGTSTGALLALGLSCPSPDAAVPASAADLVQLYRWHGRVIFPHSRLRQMRVRKYSGDALIGVMREYVGDHRLSDAVSDVLVPAYELERRTPFFFKSWRSRESAQWDFQMTEVAAAACAAPTFFEPQKLGPANGRTRSYTLIDGGIFANNPSLCAIVEARKRFPERNYLVLSVGTGGFVRRLPGEEVRDWTPVHWASRGFEIVSDGVSDAVDYHAAREPGVEYHRFQAEVPRGAEKMDNASQENLSVLTEVADALVNARREELDDLAARLKPRNVTAP